MGVDERDVERIVLRRGVGRRKRPGNWWTTQVQKRSTVILDAVAVGVTVRENRRPVIVYGYQVKSGRGFTQGDFDNCRKVALVDLVFLDLESQVGM